MQGPFVPPCGAGYGKVYVFSEQFGFNMDTSKLAMLLNTDHSICPLFGRPEKAGQA